MSSAPRRLAIALSTAVILVVGVFAGAAPASAAPPKYKVYLKQQAIDGMSKHTIVRGSGARGDTLKVWVSYYYWGSSKAPKAKVTLQRKTGSKWTTIKTAARGSGGGSYSARLPAYTLKAGTSAQVVKYRFKSSKSASRHVINTDYSKVFTVKYVNQAKYTGFQRQIYRYLAPYCPTVPVEISRETDGFAGSFAWQRGIRVAPGVASYSAEHKQSVALHECAHYKQFWNFGGSYAGLKKGDKAAAAIFVDDVNPATNSPDWPRQGAFDPIEHAADCAAHAIQPAGYLGYGGYCNPSELAAGARLMQGSKY